MSAKINKTRIWPLRWLANACGDISGWAIMHVSYLDEEENFGWRYKAYAFIWKITWPVYWRFGTFYEWSFDMSGDEWNDYDENGVPYWEKAGFVDPDYEQPWDFVDDDGDAFRIIRK